MTTDCDHGHTPVFDCVLAESDPETSEVFREIETTSRLRQTHRDVLYVLAGLKPAARSAIHPPENADRLQNAIPLPTYVSGETREREFGTVTDFYVAQTPGLLDDVVHDPPGDPAQGRAFGYPEPAVKAYARGRTDDSDYHDLRRKIVNTVYGFPSNYPAFYDLFSFKSPPTVYGTAIDRYADHFVWTEIGNAADAHPDHYLADFYDQYSISEQPANTFIENFALNFLRFPVGTLYTILAYLFASLYLHVRRAIFNDPIYPNPYALEQYDRESTASHPAHREQTQDESD